MRRSGKGCFGVRSDEPRRKPGWVHDYLSVQSATAGPLRLRGGLSLRAAAAGCHGDSSEAAGQGGGGSDGPVPSNGGEVRQSAQEVRCAVMRMVTYQAMLSNPNNLTRVQAARRAIEAAGGKVTIAPPSKEGMTLVTLLLPEGVFPAHFFPELPFYPM